MRTDVVIPTWNRADLILDCLAHLERDPSPHRAIVVDNGSTDDTVEQVRTQYPDALVVALPENLGFGAAVNAGLRAAESEHVVLINNDANVVPGFVERMCAPLADPQVGMVAGVLVDPRTGRVDSAGVVADRSLSGHAYRWAEDPETLAPADAFLLGPCGGAAAYRREAVLAIGAFDEAMFAYSEDLDVGLRMRAAGWSCALATDARAIHVGSATLGKRSEFQTRVASFSRGYIAGRYRLAARWLAAELLLGTAAAARARTLLPLRERVRGWRAGRKLPARAVPADLALDPWVQAQRRALG